MSREHVELVHRAYAALRAHDYEAWVSCFGPDVEYHSWLLELEGSFRGHEGLREWLASVLAVFPDWKPNVVEIRDLGDRALIHGSSAGEGAGSGAGMAADFWQAVEFRGGVVVWYAAFRTEAEALEAMDLRARS